MALYLVNMWVVFRARETPGSLVGLLAGWGLIVVNWYEPEQFSG